MFTSCSQKPKEDLTIPEYKAKYVQWEALPYKLSALEPYISRQTMHLHYAKHHLGYIKKADKFIEGSSFEGQSMEEIIRGTWMMQDETLKNTFNNVSQGWNHSFFWKCMHPAAEEQQIPKELEEALARSFGSTEKFKEAFKEKAKKHFGSGWVWLVEKDDYLQVISLRDGDNPMPRGYKPLLGLDVWEHAYYLDYQNKRGDYVDAFVDHLINWKFVAENLKK